MPCQRFPIFCPTRVLYFWKKHFFGAKVFRLKEVWRATAQAWISLDLSKSINSLRSSTISQAGETKRANSSNRGKSAPRCSSAKYARRIQGLLVTPNVKPLALPVFGVPSSLDHCGEILGHRQHKGEDSMFEKRSHSDF